MQPIDGLANFVMFLVIGFPMLAWFYWIISSSIRKSNIEKEEHRQIRHRAAEREYLEDMAKQALMKYNTSVNKKRNETTRDKRGEK